MPPWTITGGLCGCGSGDLLLALDPAAGVRLLTSVGVPGGGIAPSGSGLGAESSAAVGMLMRKGLKGGARPCCVRGLPGDNPTAGAV